MQDLTRVRDQMTGSLPAKHSRRVPLVSTALRRMRTTGRCRSQTHPLVPRLLLVWCNWPAALTLSGGDVRDAVAPELAMCLRSAAVSRARVRRMRRRWVTSASVRKAQPPYSAWRQCSAGHASLCALCAYSRTMCNQLNVVIRLFLNVAPPPRAL